MAAKAKGTLQFFFDIASPYSYLGFEALLQYEKQLQLNVDLKPVYLGAIFKASGNIAPALVPAKGVNMWRDVPLTAKYWGVPFKHVTNFNERILKKSTAPTLRFLTSCKELQPDYLRAAIRALYQRLYVYDKDFYEDADLIEICKQIKLPNAEQILENAKSDKIKTALRKTTEEAVDAQAFGVPWIVVKRDGKEDLIFYGSDRFPIICNELGVPFDGPKPLAKL